MNYVKRLLTQSRNHWYGKSWSKPVMHTYETLYESHAKADLSNQAVGGGDFDVVGRMEMDLLSMEGLKPGHTLVDFGCGTGRLAMHAIPALSGGMYIGIDISDTFLKRARELIHQRFPELACAVRWIKQTAPQFPLEDRSVDMICAFSVFTHMEHEDSYLYLKEAARIVRPGGRFIFSCLPMNLEVSKRIFVEQASMDLQTRWSRPRNVTTSVDLMNEISRMAGWTLVRWYDGNVRNIGSPGGETKALGQSACVLEIAKTP